MEDQLSSAGGSTLKAGMETESSEQGHEQAKANWCSGVYPGEDNCPKKDLVNGVSKDLF